MPIRPILQFPHEVLREKARSVAEVDTEIKQLVQDMFDTMYKDNSSVGLAANQVGVPVRVIVMDVSRERHEPLCLINPEILETRGKIMMDEGCLSFPNLYLPVERAEWVKIKALDAEGQPYELASDGLLGRCILHELDHIEGIVFTDYLSPAKVERLMKKLEKQRRRGAG